MSSYVRGIILYSRYWDSPLGLGSTLSVLDPWRPRLGSPVLYVHPLFSFPFSFSLGESVIEKRKKPLQEKRGHVSQNRFIEYSLKILSQRS